MVRRFMSHPIFQAFTSLLTMTPASAVWNPPTKHVAMDDQYLYGYTLRILDCTWPNIRKAIYWFPKKKEKQNIVSQMYYKLNMGRVTGKNITWIRYQANMKLLHASKIVPRSWWLATSSTCSSLRWWRIGFQRCRVFEKRVPEMQIPSLVKADDHCAADREQNSRDLEQSCHASDVQCLHSNARTIYTGISLSGQSLYICLFVANYAVICVWTLNYSVEVIEIALAMNLSVSVAIRKQRRARYVNVKYRWSDAISKIEIYTLTWETMYVIQN